MTICVPAPPFNMDECIQSLQQCAIGLTNDPQRPAKNKVFRSSDRPSNWACFSMCRFVRVVSELRIVGAIVANKTGGIAIVGGTYLGDLLLWVALLALVGPVNGEQLLVRYLVWDDTAAGRTEDCLKACMLEDDAALEVVTFNRGEIVNMSLITPETCPGISTTVAERTAIMRNPMLDDSKGWSGKSANEERHFAHFEA